MRGNPHVPQVKICGITKAEHAAAIAEMGADAVGCVFFPKSPRHLEDDQARAVCEALPPEVPAIGVFVDASVSFIMKKVRYCGLKGVQLHGKETPETVRELLDEGLLVYKGLFVSREPGIGKADAFTPTAFLVECGRGVLPGGNAKAWDWGGVRAFGEKYPLILAGGLAADNIADAVAQARPDAVDLSSAVEASPGRKDLNKVRAFLENLSKARLNRERRRIFR